MAIDTDKLNSFLGRFVGDLGASVHSGMVVIGAPSTPGKLLQALFDGLRKSNDQHNYQLDPSLR